MRSKVFEGGVPLTQSNMNYTKHLLKKKHVLIEYLSPNPHYGVIGVHHLSLSNS